MTVNQLIFNLQDYPPDTEVVVCGTHCGAPKLRLVNCKDVNGKYQRIEILEEPREGEES